MCRQGSDSVQTPCGHLADTMSTTRYNGYTLHATIIFSRVFRAGTESADTALTMRIAFCGRHCNHVQCGSRRHWCYDDKRPFSFDDIKSLCLIDINFFKNFAQLPELPTEQWVRIMQFFPGCNDHYTSNELFNVLHHATLLEIVEEFEIGQIE